MERHTKTDADACSLHAKDINGTPGYHDNDMMACGHTRLPHTGCSPVVGENSTHRTGLSCVPITSPVPHPAEKSNLR